MLFIQKWLKFRLQSTVAVSGTSLSAIEVRTVSKLVRCASRDTATPRNWMQPWRDVGGYRYGVEQL
jgi:hypothetical protein